MALAGADVRRRACHRLRAGRSARNLDGPVRLGVAIALVVAVTVESAGTPNGMGYAIMMAQQGLDPALMLAWLFWIAVVWLVSHQKWVSKVLRPTPEATVTSVREGLAGGAPVKQTWQTVGRIRRLAARLCRRHRTGRGG